VAEIPELEALVEALADAVAQRVADRLSVQLADSQPEFEDGDRYRLTYTQAEAAELLGVSVDHLLRHVLPELRVIRCGRLRLIPRAELERWIRSNAAMLGDR
jgi:excisionase family DNA binding protein